MLPSIRRRLTVSPVSPWLVLLGVVAVTATGRTGAYKEEAPSLPPVAATTYTYLGNPLGNCTGAYVGCTAETRVSGWMTFAQPLAPNLPHAFVSPSEFRFTDGRGATLGTADTLAARSFQVSTDSAGNITRWNINIAIGSTNGCLTNNTLIGSYFDLGNQAGDFSCYLVNQGLPTVSRGAAQNHNVPGSWSRANQNVAIGSLIDLPTLGGSETKALGINNDGTIVGHSLASNGQESAVTWTTGIISALTRAFQTDGSHRALAINAAGQVAGYAKPGCGEDAHAVRWDTDGTPIDLGHCGPGIPYFSRGHAINDAGVVAGYEGDNFGGPSEAFHTVNGLMTRIGRPAGAQWSVATGINTAGVIAVAAGAGSAYQADRGDNGTFSELPGIGGSARPLAINTNGVIVGHVTNATTGDLHAVRWTGGSLAMLGELPGGSQSEALAINSSGHIAGWSTTSAGHTHAVVWIGGVTYDLGALPGAETHLEATSINDAGVVAGWYVTGAETRAFSTSVVVTDEQAPTVMCAAPDGVWHATNISLACTATDALSGLANGADASLLLTTGVPAGVETANAQTSARTICDVAGNCSTAGPIGGSKIDLKGPSIAIGSPAATTYRLHENVVTGYGCTDTGSGVDSCGSAAERRSLVHRRRRLLQLHRPCHRRGRQSGNVVGRLHRVGGCAPGRNLAHARVDAVCAVRARGRVGQRSRLRDGRRCHRPAAGVRHRRARAVGRCGLQPRHQLLDQRSTVAAAARVPERGRGHRQPDLSRRWRRVRRAGLRRIRHALHLRSHQWFEWHVDGRAADAQTIDGRIERGHRRHPLCARGPSRGWPILQVRHRRPGVDRARGITAKPHVWGGHGARRQVLCCGRRGRPARAGCLRSGNGYVDDEGDAGRVPAPCGNRARRKRCTSLAEISLPLAARSSRPTTS